MARKSSPTISQEELYPPYEQEFPRDDTDDTEDSRLLDLDAVEESPFLRAQKRVSVRRGALPKKAATRLKWAVLLAAVLVAAGFASVSLYRYGEHSWRFRIESSDDIEITGTHNVTHAQVMEVLGGDIGRNIFFIPLGQRKAQLEKIPWVESASIMRFVSNRLRVEIHERTPVAFARIGPRISLVDPSGTIMDLPMGSKKRYSFPVILGMNAGEPPSTRAARMKIYNQFIAELDSGGGHYSQDLSEVDLSDVDDVRVSVADSSGAVLVHLGSSNFLDRYKVYVGHVREWRQQFEKLDSVDLRYDGQIIVNPDLRGMAKQPPLSVSATRLAISAGVKPAALLSREATVAKAVPQGVTDRTSAKAMVKPAAKNRKTKWAKSTKHVASVAKHKPMAANADTHAAETNAKSANKTGDAKAKAAVVPSTSQPTPAAPTGASTNATPIKPSSSDGSKKKPSPGIMKDQDQR